MRRFFSHAMLFIFRGLLAVIPLVLSFSAIKLLYVLIDKPVLGVIDSAGIIGPIEIGGIKHGTV